jgi:hypothetical protein
MEARNDYAMFMGFIEKYLPQGFDHISRLEPFIVTMEEKLRAHNQFFYIADLLKIRILFTSWGSQKIIGLSPEQVDTSTFFVLAHPEDQEQLNRAQTKLYKMGQDLFINQKGISIVSVLIREKNGAGDYINLLLQTYSFYSTTHNTVFTMIMATELTSFKPGKDSIHYYYAGDDPARFRYPDDLPVFQTTYDRAVSHCFPVHTYPKVPAFLLAYQGFGLISHFVHQGPERG